MTYDTKAIGKWQTQLAFCHKQRMTARQVKLDLTQGQLAMDTINVTLNMAGHDIGAMSQFDKAHALMDMAQELKGISNRRTG